MYLGQDQAAFLERRAALRNRSPFEPRSNRCADRLVSCSPPALCQTVSHFAGEVVYEAAGWRERNNDELHRDLLTLLGDTDHALLAQLFPPVEEVAGVFETGTVKKPTICQVFALDLDGLMGEFAASQVHFVRCIKPNDALAPGAPDAGLVLDQLRFSGMLEAVSLISSGYPGRIPFVEKERTTNDTAY